MKITILNTHAEHPINAWLAKWIATHQNKHEINLLRSKSELIGGDLLFLISCSELIAKEDRENFEKTLVIHASDLPRGRGWSPHVWDIISGASEISLTLLEAEDKVDSGDIWRKLKVSIPSTALFDEINKIVFDAELELMDFAIENFNHITPEKQSLEILPSYWPKRTPKDSEVDITKTIEQQFDLIRVCDTDRFPVFFYIHGKKFTLKIEAIDE
jgi:methionyl-tRNA formyltransferase